MEEVSGSDLGWFFQQWLYRAGSPVIEGGWKYDAAARRVTIDLTQTQPGEVFRLPLQIAISADGAARRIETIHMTAKQQQFTVASDREPAAVDLDPDTWMLAETHFSKR